MTGSKFGMISLDKALVNLVEQGLVSAEDAAAKAHDPEFVRSGGRGGGM
jgi:Tfp pilus assembly pilus retraction ATPase PilT